MSTVSLESPAARDAAPSAGDDCRDNPRPSTTHGDSAPGMNPSGSRSLKDPSDVLRELSDTLGTSGEKGNMCTTAAAITGGEETGRAVRAGAVETLGAVAASEALGVAEAVGDDGCAVKDAKGDVGDEERSFKCGTRGVQWHEIDFMARMQGCSRRGPSEGLVTGESCDGFGASDPFDGLAVRSCQ